MKKILLSAGCGVSVSALIECFNKKEKNIKLYSSDIKDCSNDNLDGNIIFPYCLDNENLYISHLDKILEKFDAFYPYADEELEVISTNLEKFNNAHKIVISDLETIKICSNKKKLQQKLTLNNILTPTFNNDFYGKKIIKPIYGRGGRNILITEDKGLVNFFTEMKSNQFLVTDYIEGTEYSADVLYSSDGKNILDLLIRKRPNKGIADYCKEVYVNSIYKSIEEISKILTFSGPINFQFIIDKSNFAFLIEINPRLSGGMVFSYFCGFNPFSEELKKLKNHKKTMREFKAFWKIKEII